jgi:hypothetical protein
VTRGEVGGLGDMCENSEAVGCIGIVYYRVQRSAQKGMKKDPRSGIAATMCIVAENRLL